MGLTQLTGEVLDEKYRIEKELGKGGMGSVYLATHLGTGRPVAVKVITPQFMMNDEFVERFRREAKAAGRLHHPNVVNVTDFGFAQVDGERIAYLVMEYLDGCTLAEVLSEESQLPIDWVVDIVEQTSSAVEEAHQQGIIHRDLKPDNIWLEPNRRGGYTVKVLDFGLAKLGDVQLTDGAEGAPSASSPDRKSVQRDSTTVSNQPRQTGIVEAKTYAQAADLSEAATRIQRSPVSEDATLILAEKEPVNISAADESATQVFTLESEAATQIQLAHVSEEERTRVFEHTTAENLARQTVPADGLTRVGSILGTPIYMFINYSLASPVVMMEGLKGRAALKRSKALVKRSRRTVIVILFLQFAIPALAASLVALPFAVVLKGLRVEYAPILTSRITTMVTAALNALIVPFIATLTALLYLKTRQMGGETLKEALSQFEEEDTPRTKWQMRMRERLQTTTKP